MNSTNEVNNEGKINYHHNLRKNRKPRNYDFEYFDESMNKPKCRKKRKRKKTLKNIIGSINKNVNSLKIHKLKRAYIKKKYKENKLYYGDIESDRGEFILDKNYYLSHKSISLENPYIKNKKTKKFNFDKNVYLFNSNITLRNNNIKVDRICEYLTYKTNTIWKYMGSTVKFKLLNNQQEKYIFLKNMKKHIIFEIIKIAMFALLKVNLNDNNIYTLKFLGMQKTLQRNYDNGNILLRNSCHLNENSNDCNYGKSNNEKKKTENRKNNCKLKQDNKKDVSNSIDDKKYLNFLCNNYEDSKIDINKRLEIKNDILNQGVTVSEILDFVKEKYEKYYENVKQYIVTTLNIYCALNIFKLIRRGRYAICKYKNFNIFKVKYYRKYHKFFYSLKGEEEILLNIKNYLKSFYYDKNKKKKVSTKDEGCQRNKRDIPNMINEKNKTIKKKKERNVTKNKVDINEFKRTDNVLNTVNNSMYKNKKIENSIINVPLNTDNKGNDLKNNVLSSIKKKKMRKVSKVEDNESNNIYDSSNSDNIIESGMNVTNNNSNYSLNSSDYKIKNVFIDLNKINIKCIKVVYGMKHFFCSYDTNEKSDKNFEIIKVQKKYGLLRRKNMVNMNLRYNFLYNTKRLLNSYYPINDDCNLTNTKNFFLRNNNINKEEEKKAPQYGKQKKQNSEDDSSLHEKYNYVNFNLSYKTLRKKMICLRHFTHNNKKEEKCFKQKQEIKMKDKLQNNISNECLIHTYSINSNFSNLLSNDELSINLKSHCSQKSL